MIRKLEKEEAFSIYSYLEKDFIEEERPSYSFYQKKIEEGKQEVFWYEEEGIKKAYMICCKEEDTILVLFFAVLEPYRGSGVGSHCIQELKTKLEKNQVLLFEVESEENETTEEEKERIKRRIRFYERLGCKKVEGIFYQLRGISYHIFFLGRENMEAKEAKEKIQAIYQGRIKNPKWIQIEVKKKK